MPASVLSIYLTSLSLQFSPSPDRLTRWWTTQAEQGPKTGVVVGQPTDQAVKLDTWIFANHDQAHPWMSSLIGRPLWWPLTTSHRKENGMRYSWWIISTIRGKLPTVLTSSSKQTTSQWKQKKTFPGFRHRYSNEDASFTDGIPRPGGSRPSYSVFLVLGLIVSTSSFL